MALSSTCAWWTRADAMNSIVLTAGSNVAWISASRTNEHRVGIAVRVFADMKSWAASGAWRWESIFRLDRKSDEGRGLPLRTGSCACRWCRSWLPLQCRFRCPYSDLDDVARVELRVVPGGFARQPGPVALGVRHQP